MHHFLEIFFSLAPVFCMSNQKTGDSSSATNTGTTSGTSSPVAAENSLATAPGSIGVGSGKYLESGAMDNTNANLSTSINAGSGASVVIGDPNADNMISQLAQQFSNAVQGVAGAAAAGGASAGNAGGSSGTISLKTIGIFIAIVAAIIGLFTLLERKK
jgi:hypothetical protein